MDSKKIGTFISNKRKEKQMTQKQLGEALNCSDKLISKWECGNGLPDVSMMLPLCELLEINVNELLSGEHLTQDSYLGKAEENMMNLIKTNENQKKLVMRGLFSGIVLILGFVIIMIIFALMNAHPISLLFYLDGIGVLEVLLILILSLWYAGRLKDFKNAFVFMFFEPENPQTLRNAVTAVALAEKALIVGGVFTSTFYVIHVLYEAQTTGSTTAFYTNMAVALLTLFYGILGVMILAPIKGRLEKKL